MVRWSVRLNACSAGWREEFADQFLDECHTTIEQRHNEIAHPTFLGQHEEKGGEGFGKNLQDMTC